MKTEKLIAVSAILVAISGCATVQETTQYPTQPVKVVVPYPQGNVADSFGRIVAEKLSQRWGQPVIVENQPGIPGVEAVAKAKPDGYTLLTHSISYAVDASLYTNLPYDPGKSFSPIAPFAKQPFALVASPALGVKSVTELVDLAKSRQGEMKFGSLGTTSQIYFVAEQFRKQSGVQATNVSYKGVLDANAAVAQREVAFWFPPVAGAMAGIRDGKLVALAVTGEKRSAMLPLVPTMAEAGIPNMESTAWFGFWAPAGVPSVVVEKIAQDIAQVMASPDVREKFAKSGAEPMNMTPAQFSVFVRDETEASGRLIKELGIKHRQQRISAVAAQPPVRNPHEIEGSSVGQP